MFWLWLWLWIPGDIAFGLVFSFPATNAANTVQPLPAPLPRHGLLNLPQCFVLEQEMDEKMDEKMDEPPDWKK